MDTKRFLGTGVCFILFYIHESRGEAHMCTVAKCSYLQKIKISTKAFKLKFLHVSLHQ